MHRASPVDVEAVDWSLPLPDGEVPLHPDLAAGWLAAAPPGALVRPLTGSSRAPGSRLNRVGHLLSSDLTSQLLVHGARDDRGRDVVRAEVRGANRRARRALDGVGLGDGWVRTRGSSTTAVRRDVLADADPRATAARTTAVLVGFLDRLGWPLEAWRLTLPER